MKVCLSLVCKKCKHGFELSTDYPLAEDAKQDVKRCPNCGSESIRQTFRSFLRNGPVLDRIHPTPADVGPTAEAGGKRRGRAAPRAHISAYCLVARACVKATVI